MGVLQADLEPLVEEPDAVVGRDERPDQALRVLDPVDVEALEHLEPLRTPELRAGVDGGLEADPTSRLTIGRFRPLLRHALTSGNPRRRPASAAAGPGVPHHPVAAARGQALLADRYARVRQGHGTRSKRRKLGLGAEPELWERAFRAIWRTGHNGDSRPSTGSARTHATAFTQTDGSLDGTRKESAVIWLKYRDALGVLHHGLAGSERGAHTPMATG